METISAFLLGFIPALWGWLVAIHLIEPDEIFDFVPFLVLRVSSNYKLHKMIYACSKCVAGQWALWLVPVLQTTDFVFCDRHFIDLNFCPQNYSLFLHFVTILSAMFFSILLERYAPN